MNDQITRAISKAALPLVHVFPQLLPVPFIVFISVPLRIGVIERILEGSDADQVNGE